MYTFVNKIGENGSNIFISKERERERRRCFVFVVHTTRRVSLRGKATADCFPLALYASTTIPRINYVTAATSPRATLPPLNHPPSLPPSPPPPLIHFHFLFQLLRPHRTLASVIYPPVSDDIPTVFRKSNGVLSFRVRIRLDEERKKRRLEESRRVSDGRIMVSVFK